MYELGWVWASSGLPEAGRMIIADLDQDGFHSLIPQSADFVDCLLHSLLGESDYLGSMSAACRHLGLSVSGCSDISALGKSSQLPALSRLMCG